MDLFTGGSVIMDYKLILVRSNGLNLIVDLFPTNMQLLSSQHIN